MAYKQLKLWFDKELAELLSDKILGINPEFNSRDFIKNVDTKVKDLELKDRVEVIADELHEFLRKDYKENVSLLLSILGPENDQETGMFSNFYWVMPIAKYIEKYGQDDFELSMQAIEEITKRNTGEYTIRPFIETYPGQAMKQMLVWSEHGNPHVRRLSSEGGRPRLPWAPKLQQFIDDPSPLIPILENLKDDTSKYVQKSVANCLNDILKDNPEIGKQVIIKWSEDYSSERKWIIQHALRNQVKINQLWAKEVLEKLWQ